MRFDNQRYDMMVNCDLAKLKVNVKNIGNTMAALYMVEIKFQPSIRTVKLIMPIMQARKQFTKSADIIAQ